MTLVKYKEKRNIKKNPEHIASKPGSDKLRFVVQLHETSHLHYELRLEINGILKSWTVPKGPSTDTDAKRLAIMVEDHPYDYINFEGIISSGYDAGTVLVWDNGFYEMADAYHRDKTDQDKELQKGIKSGKLHFVLHGKKLKGEFMLVNTNSKEENIWLLYKMKDEYVSKNDITLNDKSVLSKKTLNQIKLIQPDTYTSKHKIGTRQRTKKLQ